MSLSDEDKRLLRESVSRLVVDKIEPHAKAIDENSEIPDDVYKALIRTGLHAATVPAQYGGGGASILDGAILIEEVARGSAAVSSILVMNLAGTAALAASSNKKLKEDLLPSVYRGDAIIGWSTDDLEAQGGLIATEDAEGLVLNGTVSWVPCIEAGEKLVVLVEARSQSGSYLVAVDASKPIKGHLQFGAVESDLGLRGTLLRPLVLKDVAVSSGDIVGSGAGSGNVLGALRSVGRVGIAAQAVGIGSASIGYARAYVGERHQFGVAIAEFESTRAILGNMALNIEAARQLTYVAANRMDFHTLGWDAQDSIPTDFAAKWLASKVAVEVAIDAVQLFGGYGFVKDYPVERLMRDAKLTQMMLGTSQILDIADSLLSR